MILFVFHISWILLYSLCIYSVYLLPSILLQGFAALWSGAAVGPESLPVFLCGGVGSFIADRLKLVKKDVPLLVYSTIAGALGGFLGSPIVGAIGAIE